MRIQLGASTFVYPITDISGTLIYTTGSSETGLGNYIEIDGSWTDITDMVSYKEDGTAYPNHYVAKLTAIGYDSQDLHETWATRFSTLNLIDGEATHAFTALGETATFTGPTYDINTVAKTDLDFEFYYDEAGV